MEKQDQELIQKYLSIDPELKRCMEEHENMNESWKNGIAGYTSLPKRKWKEKKSRN